MADEPKKPDLAKELLEQTKVTKDKAMGLAKGIFSKYKDALKGPVKPGDDGSDKK